MKNKTIKLAKVEKLETNEGIIQTLNWFFSFPEVKITLSDLAKEIGISKKTASKIVSSLKEEGFLIVEEIGKAWRIHCNVKHPYNQTLKIGNNLSLVYNSGIIAEIYKVIGNPKAIILFGSYRKGDNQGSSDLDIAVEVVGNSDLEIKNIGNLSQLGFRKNVPVNLHIFTRNKIDLNLFANIANGILLDGFLEVRP